MPSFDKGRIKRKTLFIPYTASLNLLGASGVSALAHTGVAVEQELSTLGAVGILMTAGDMFNVYHPTPRDMNWSKPMGLQLMFATGSATAADKVDWIGLYDIIEEDAAVAVGTTALDTVFDVTDTVAGVANSWQWSTRGVINGGKFSEANVTGGDLMSFNFELDSTDASEDIILFGVQIDYVPKRFQGPPNSFNPGLTDE